MTLREFTQMVRRRLLLVGAIAAVIVGGTLLWSLLSPTLYNATSTLFVSVQGVNVDTGFKLVQNERIDSYAELGTSRRVLRRAAEQAGYDGSVSQLHNRVTIVHPPGSVLIDVNVLDESADQAAELSNAIAAQMARMVERLEAPPRPGIGPSLINVSIAEPATPPSSPAYPKVMRNMLFALIIGIALGLAAAVLREIFDRRLRDPAAARDLIDLPVLATVDFDKRIKVHPVLLEKSDLDEEMIAQERLAEMWSKSRVSEEFRQLRVNLQFFDFEEDRRSVMVTSSKPGEGKTTVAANLAVTMALAGEPVVLIDCDLRRPSISKTLGIEADSGLTDVLIGRKKLDDVLITGRRLSVLPAGPVPPNPTELLGSQAMADLLTELHGRYQTVIIDTPPCLPFADPAVLAPLCGATLLVVRMNYTNSDDLERSAMTLNGVQARLCGSVANMVTRGSRGGGDYYYYYYAANGSSDDLVGSGFNELTPRGTPSGHGRGG